VLDALILTLGFEPGPLVSAIASGAAEGFSREARVVVLTAAYPDERSERAWLQLQQIFKMMELEKKLNVKLERIEIPLEDMTEAVQRVKEVLKTVAKGRVKLAITGGMRALGLALFIAYLLTDWTEEPRIEIYLEGRGMALEVPRLRRLLLVKLSKVHLEMLRCMKPEVAYTSTDLAGLLGKDRSTIYRYLQALADRGLLERTPEGFKLSKLGLLLR